MAELVDAPDSGSGFWEFESPLGYHINQGHHAVTIYRLATVSGKGWPPSRNARDG